MRIIKYLFLLFLLSLVALTIYIATQKGNFTVKSSKIINSPKSTVFNYVNDYKNWPKFSPWISSDSSISTSFSPTTIGNGSTFTWDGTFDSGTIQTLYTKGNDSIVQKMEFNNTSAKVFWHFKDTVGGTKVTWKSVGKMDFMMKVNSLFNRGTHNTLSNIYDKCLANLDKTLNFENNTYEVKVNGIVQKLGTYYLRQSFTSKITDISKNADAVFSKITAFCNQNNISQNGRPFIIFKTYDTIKNLTRASFCVPIKEQIFTSEGSDISAGKLNAFRALKTSLKGNYSYKSKALNKTSAHTTAYRIVTDTTFSHLEVYTIGKNETLSPSKWVTDIYIPLRTKGTAPTNNRVAKDSITVYNKPNNVTPNIITNTNTNKPKVVNKPNNFTPNTTTPNTTTSKPNNSNKTNSAVKPNNSAKPKPNNTSSKPSNTTNKPTAKPNNNPQSPSTPNTPAKDDDEFDL